MNEQPNTPISNIASRPKRLSAALIDGAAGMLVSMPVFAHFGFFEALRTQTPLPENISNGLTLFSLAVFFLLHGYLLFNYGQTLGKRLMGLAIVTLEGQKPHFGHLILTRYLPQWVLGVVPVMGPILSLVDVLFIFGNNQNRCVHDLIARTKVIDLTIKPMEVDPLAGNNFIA